MRKEGDYLIPTLLTERLILRPFALSDAKEVYEAMNDPEIYLTTLNIPKPYTLDIAQNWIRSHQGYFIEKGLLTLAAVCKESMELVGSFSISVDKKNNMGEIGYWIRKKSWNKGYGTEGAFEIIHYGFKEAKLNKIIGRHFNNNPQSGQIMVKCGMKKEGLHKEALYKEGYYHDVVYYSILRSDWLMRDDNIKEVNIFIRKSTTNDLYSLYFLHLNIDTLNKWEDILELLEGKEEGLDLLVENNKVIGYKIVEESDDYKLKSGVYILGDYKGILNFVNG